MVSACVEREGLRYRVWFDEAVNGDGAPADRIIALFEALHRQVAADDCRGCPFQQLAAELARDRSGESDEVFDVDDLAHDLILVMEGVYASVLSMPATGPALRAIALVRRLVDGR